MANNAKTPTVYTITAPVKARKALSLASLDLAKLHAYAASRTTGSGGGYKGARHDEATTAALRAALAAGKVDIASPAAAILSFAAAIGGGHCRWIMAPASDGTFTHGPKPLAPVNHKEIPQGAAVAQIPPCGAFQGGLEIVAPATITGKKSTKNGIALWRMVKGELSPVVMLLEDGSKAYAAAQQAADAASVPLATVALLAHLTAHNQGGKGLALVAASMTKEGGK